MLSLRKINHEKVSAISVPIIDKSKIKSSELFEELYRNIFLLAKKKSGKTSTILKFYKNIAIKIPN
jgi:hypothetical protein